MKYSVYWTNMGYASDVLFDTVGAAIAYARSKCFEATIYYCVPYAKISTSKLVASWSPIGGTKIYK